MTVAQWMWADGGIGVALTRGLHWSSKASVTEMLFELCAVSSKERPVRIWVQSSLEVGEERELVCECPGEAISALHVSQAIDVICAIDKFRLRKAKRFREASLPAWPPSTPPEQCSQCIECTSPTGDHCSLCGLALCTQPRFAGFRCLTIHPSMYGAHSPDRVKACRRCAPYVQARAASRSALRIACANVFRDSIGGKNLDICLSGMAPPLEDNDDCAGCGIIFDWTVPGRRENHCRACGRALCGVCLCGSITCQGKPLTCPHKALLPQFGYTRQEKVCKDCLNYVHLRLTAREALKSILCTAEAYSNHYFRVVTFLEDPDTFPLYEQDFVDTASNKAVRAGTMAIQGARLITPLLSMPYAFGINAAHVAWNYGQYGLVGLFFSGEIVEGLQTLYKMSAVLRTMEPRELLVGIMYLSAEQRRASRSDPESAHREAMARGRAVGKGLLDLLIGLAGVGMHAPYEEKAFEVQRLAMQQNWRLITERLGESSKHKPAWCLYCHRECKVAVVAVRGTDLDKSAGGDLFTDVDAMPETCVGANGVVVHAHSGMLASARALEPEFRQAVRVLASRGFQIAFVGHSLGAGVVALLVWLLKHGSDGERLTSKAQIYGIGYAMPSVMDRASAEEMRPYFTSVVNPMDVVSRLGVASVQQLADEILACAKESMSDLEEDVGAVVDRVASVWAPKVRIGNQPDEGAEMAEAPKQTQVQKLLKTLSRTATASFDTSSTKSQKRKGNNTEAESESSTLENVGSLGARDTSLLECREGDVLWVPNGADSVLLAWYGNASMAWQTKEGVGIEVTERVQALLRSCPKSTVLVTSKTLGNPCPKVRKKLFVLARAGKGTELFCPGVVVWIYRRRGSLQAAQVPLDTPSLRRIFCDKRMLADHGKLAYHQALLTVHANLNSTRSVVWQSFADAGDYCPCCHNLFDWESTSRSKKRRWASMTNCRACGLVICVSCSSTRRAIPDLGIIEPARVCDICAWSGPDGAEALRVLPEVFAAAAVQDVH